MAKVPPQPPLSAEECELGRCCIGCGCFDAIACAVGCSWIKLHPRFTMLGVCSECPSYTELLPAINSQRLARAIYREKRAHAGEDS